MASLKYLVRVLDDTPKALAVSTLVGYTALFLVSKSYTSICIAGLPAPSGLARPFKLAL